MSHRTMVFALLVVSLVSTGSLHAQRTHQGTDPLSLRTFSDARFQPAPAVARLEAVQGSVVPPAARASWASFQAATAVRWQAYIDQRTGRLESAVGGGVPWIAGTGKTDLATLEATARAALPGLEPLLGVDAASLVLNHGRSGQQAEFLWYVDFDVRQGGLTVEGARVVFRVSHGNLIEIGAENLPAPGVTVPKALYGREQAIAAVSDYVGGFGAGDFIADSGSLHLLPVNLSDPRFAGGYEAGNGRGLALVWEVTFHRRGVTGSWRARVDAEDGRVIELLDTNRYDQMTGQATGGVFPVSPTVSPETELPMPFADVNSATADAAGFYSVPAPVTSHLNGPYVQIGDTCGAIGKTSDWTGNVDFGLSGGTDCTTPGPGQGGDTHSARNQFYHVNRIKEAGRSWLPTNTWLQSTLTVNVNLNQTCNAYWDNITGTLNFFRSGGGCNNTGEIAAVSLHEYGHGLDQNDGNGSSPDNGTGETYGDFTSALVTHNSCIGPGFLPTNCLGYGNACTSCTGVRDIDYAKHSSATPATVASFTQPRCGGARPDYPGPCGLEGHCESYVSSEALWDFANRDLPSPGSAGAWTITEGLWYLSRATATSAFTCHTVTPTWTSDGCATGSLWRTLRAADDDDGNLANGTPHGAALFAAFNRHGIACATDPGAGVTFAGCTPPAVPSVTLTPSAGQVQVSWTSSGAGTVYDVYRSELGCGAGFVRVANSVAGTVYNDTPVSNGFTYSYQVVAHPVSGTACAAAPTACQSATTSVPVCAPPAPPATVTATSVSISRIDLSWSVSAGASGYNVYRAANSAGPYTLVATVTGGTTFSNLGLIGSTPYFYKVRAFAGVCESSDSAVATAATAICQTVSVYKNTFETGSGLGDWTTSVVSTGSNDWRGIQACSPTESGTHIFRFGGASCSAFYADSEAAVASPPTVAIPIWTGNARLSFWHRRDFEPGYDGGAVVAYLDGSSRINFVPNSALSGTVYDNAIASGSFTCPPAGLGGVASFGNTASAMTNTTVDLDAVCNASLASTNGCAGHTVKPGFLSITDCAQGAGGWYLDDVEVTACQPPLDFYTLTPCRLIDTRSPTGPLGGPSLPAGGTRTFTVAGACGIPPSAQSLTINLTAVTPGSGGYLQVYGGSSVSPPVTASITFNPGVTRANNGMVSLAFDGTGTITVKSGASTPVDFVIDVTGYYK